MNREQINTEAERLTKSLNERLKDFQPTGRFAGYAQAMDYGMFHTGYRGDSINDGGQMEAQELVDHWAGDDWEVRVMEIIGGPQRFVASVQRYLGPAPFDG